MEVPCVGLGMTLIFCCHVSADLAQQRPQQHEYFLNCQEAKEVVFELQRSLPKWRQVGSLFQCSKCCLPCQNSWIVERFAEALSTVLECCTFPVSLVDISADSAVPSQYPGEVLGITPYHTKVQEDALQVLIESWVQIPRPNSSTKVT